MSRYRYSVYFHINIYLNDLAMCHVCLMFYSSLLSSSVAVQCFELHEYNALFLCAACLTMEYLEAHPSGKDNSETK